MVIKDLLNKVNSSTENKNQVDSLKEKLAKLRGEKEPGSQIVKEQLPSQTKEDKAIEQLVGESEEERKQFAQQQEPTLRVKEEKTHRLIAKQIAELLELTANQKKSLMALEQENKKLTAELERTQKTNQDIQEKMSLIDKRLEKFMGLYELITNQYNPFSELQDVQQGKKRTQNELTAEAATQAQKMQRIQVTEELTGQQEDISYEPGEMSSENKQKIHQLITELGLNQEAHGEESREGKEEHTTNSSAEQSVALAQQTTHTQALSQELHSLFEQFETKLKNHFQEEMQGTLTEVFSQLETVLNDEIQQVVDHKLKEFKQSDSLVNEAITELAQLEEKSLQPEQYAQEITPILETVESVQEDMRTVAPQFYFKLINGTVLKNTQDLIQALQTMDEQTYAYHVTEFHNDFAEWAEYVLEHPAAQKLRTASRAEMISLLQA